jgi:hypothetical protein
LSETTEDHLAWEAERRTRAGAAAILGGLLTMSAAITSAAVFRGIPRAGFVESIQHTAQPGPIGARPSLRIPLYQFYSDHAGAILASALVHALGFLALGYALVYLARATFARRPALSRAALYLPWVGAGVLAVQAPLSAIGTNAAVSDFLDGPRTVQAASDLTGNGLLVVGSLLDLAGRLALGSALVLICLNAMRAGLLTRFMGVLGIIVGVLNVLPITTSLPPAVQFFWLIALGGLFLGRWPGGVPPAWRTGQAEPWPSSQEVRQARRAEAERRRGGGAKRAEPAPDEPVTVPSERPHPSSKKRKRKRRA